MRSSRTTIILLLLLALFGGVAYYAITKQQSGSSAVNMEDRNFAVKDRSEIHKILLAQRDGKKIILERVGNEWYTQEGRQLVHPNVMGNLLDVLSGLQLKYIPPRSAYENMMKAIATIGIKVEVYGENDQKLRSYQVGGTTSGELGTVFLMDGYTQPYVLEISNFEGSLRGRFLVNEIDQIRDRTLFSYDREEIKQIAIKYPKDQAQSFKVVREGDDFSVRPYSKEGYVIRGDVKPGTVQSFLRAFQDLDGEAYENNHPLKDSIQALIPLAEISVQSTEGQTRSVRLFPLIDVFNQDINTRAVDVDKRIERYFADCSWGDFMIVQDLLFRKVLWRYEEFY